MNPLLPFDNQSDPSKFQSPSDSHLSNIPPSKTAHKREKSPKAAKHKIDSASERIVRSELPSMNPTSRKRKASVIEYQDSKAAILSIPSKKARTETQEEKLDSGTIETSRKGKRTLNEVTNIPEKHLKLTKKPKFDVLPESELRHLLKRLSISSASKEAKVAKRQFKKLYLKQKIEPSFLLSLFRLACKSNQKFILKFLYEQNNFELITRIVCSQKNGHRIAIRFFSKQPEAIDKIWLNLDKNTQHRIINAISNKTGKLELTLDLLSKLPELDQIEFFSQINTDTLDINRLKFLFIKSTFQIQLAVIYNLSVLGRANLASILFGSLSNDKKASLVSTYISQQNPEFNELAAKLFELMLNSEQIAVLKNLSEDESFPLIMSFFLLCNEPLQRRILYLIFSVKRVSTAQNLFKQLAFDKQMGSYIFLTLMLPETKQYLNFFGDKVNFSQISPALKKQFITNIFLDKVFYLGCVVN